MPTTTQSSRLGMHDALRRAADAGPRKERQTDIPSAPRSRQAMVVGERGLVKAAFGTASGGSGLDKASLTDIWRCPRDRTAGAGRGTRSHAPHRQRAHSTAATIIRLIRPTDRSSTGQVPNRGLL